MSHLESHRLYVALAFHLGAGRAGRAVPAPEQYARRWSARDHALIARLTPLETTTLETGLTPLETVRIRKEKVEAVAHGLVQLRLGAVRADVELVKGHAEPLQIADGVLSRRTLMELLRHLQRPLHSHGQQCFLRASQGRACGTLAFPQLFSLSSRRRGVSFSVSGSLVNPSLGDEGCMEVVFIISKLFTRHEHVHIMYTHLTTERRLAPNPACPVMDSE